MFICQWKGGRCIKDTKETERIANEVLEGILRDRHQSQMEILNLDRRRKSSDTRGRKMRVDTGKDKLKCGK